jgi:hypothetical protein
MEPYLLKVTHNAGFFSCQNVKLQKIIEFFNIYKKLPSKVDSSEQLIHYKNSNIDITPLYFKIDNINIIEYKDNIKITDLDLEEQFSPYKNLNFQEICPFISKYFTFSDIVIKQVDILINKYQIDYNNTCSLFFRGNDKCKETTQPTYKEFVDKAISVCDANTVFLIQTDEYEFLKYCIDNLKNVIFFKEIPHIKSNPEACIGYILKDKETHTLYYLASVYIMSKCKNLITTSGNGEMFCVLTRGNSKNVYQFLKPNEYIYGIKNVYYDPLQTNFWF